LALFIEHLQIIIFSRKKLFGEAGQQSLNHFEDHRVFKKVDRNT